MFRGSNIQGFLSPRIQGFMLHTGVLHPSVYHSGVLNLGFLDPGVLHLGVVTSRGLQL